MKKYFLAAMAATAMLAGCSSDEVIENSLNNQSKAIAFDGFINKSVRGVDNDITTANFKSFEVWGLMSKDGQTGHPFDKVTVTKPGTEWSYGTPVYWEQGYNYSFVAVAPAAEADNWTLTDPTEVGKYGAIDFNNGDGTTDLIYAKDDTYATTAVDISNSCPMPIHFTFNHLLSRVKFNFTNAMDDGSVINVTNVAITNANASAKADLDAAQLWTLAADNEAGNLAFGNVLLEETEENFAQNASKETDHKYMIPATSEGQVYQVTFTVTRTHNGVTDTYNHTVNLPATAMEPGKSYLFTATLNAQNINPDAQMCPIQFSASVTEWGEFGEGTEILPQPEEEQPAE